MITVTPSNQPCEDEAQGFAHLEAQDESDGNEDSPPAAVFDIETAPLDDETLRRLCPECAAPDHPGEFDPASVKYGNTKDPVKRAEKLKDEQEKHAAAVRDYEANCTKKQQEHFEKFKAEAALDAVTGRVVVIGFRTPAGDDDSIDCDGDNECSGIREFWSRAEELMADGVPLVGFNTHGFDLPFLVRRSRILGVPVPFGVRNGRYWAQAFIDLAAEWTSLDGGRPWDISLDTLAKAFGLEGKAKGQFTLPSGEVVLVDGAHFYEAWRRPECRQLAEAYLAADLRIPAELAVRMGVV